MIDVEKLDQELLTSENFNSCINDFYDEIVNAYLKMETYISELDTTHNKNINNINNILNQLGTLETQLNEYESSIVNIDGYTQVFIENFQNNNNIESDKSQYNISLLSNNDKIRPMIYKNNFGKVESYIDSSIELKHSVIIQQRNYVEYETIGSINNTRDNSSQSFWYETVKFKESVDFLNYQFEIGIIVELILDIKEITKINKIIMKPFTKYPLKILQMTYYDSESKKELIFEDITKVFIDGTLNYTFSDIYTNKIKIRLQQIHYEKINNEYIYNIGLYTIQLLYNNYATSTQFLSKPIELKHDKLIDYYSLETEDSKNINYTIVEYFDDSAGFEKNFKRDILVDNVNQILEEEVQVQIINGKAVFTTKYPFSSITVICDGAVLLSTTEYFCYDNQNIQLFNYKQDSVYKVNYTFSDNIVKTAFSGQTKPKYIRVMAYSKNSERPSFIKKYVLKINYKENPKT